LSSSPERTNSQSWWMPSASVIYNGSLAPETIGAHANPRRLQYYHG
jgi:hypothetical protein